ncbi:MAG: PilN domain-containing protein [Negativicutes bacterium]
MIRINLLPLSRRMPQFSFVRFFTLAGLVAFFLCSAWYGYGTYRLWGLNQEVQKTMSRYELLRPTQSKMQDANAMQQQINQKERLLMELTVKRQSQYAVLTHLAEIIPPQIWLYEITVDEQKRFHIKGQASAYAELASFLDQIEKDPLYGSPSLVKAEQDAVLSTMKFEITVVGEGM